IEFRTIVEKHVELSSLKNLALELIQMLWNREQDHEKKNFVNGLIREVKQSLKFRTSATQVEDVDLYKVKMDDKRIQKFTEIVEILKNEAVIFKEEIQGFRIEAKRVAYAGAAEIKTMSGVKTAFSDAYKYYGNPHEYLRRLLENESLSRSELYKLFVNIRYRILNNDGFEVSGGERSEFRLLQEISDAQNYDILLIDEPESSFDNLFLKSDVNQIIKGISETMPVVVVTHNSTVGWSVGSDYVLYARKEVEDGKPIYRLYSGYPTDKNLVSLDGKIIKSHEVIIDSLEAGINTYEDRRKAYEAIKN